MKINEIPKKIYLDYELDDDKNHLFINYMWHRHPFPDKNLINVEYTRIETFLDRACEFFESRMWEKRMPDDNYLIVDRFTESKKDFIEQFKKYIKEEQ